MRNSLRIADRLSSRTPLASQNSMPKCICTQFAAPIESITDVEARCAASGHLSATLDEIATDAQKWMGVYRCRECGTLWAQEYPFGERHGGGPPCLYAIRVADPVAWLSSATSITHVLRQRHEDRAFLDAIGPEVGPEICRKDGCSRHHIHHSVFCRPHHFEMIKGRPYSEA